MDLSFSTQRARWRWQFVIHAVMTASRAIRGFGGRNNQTPESVETCTSVAAKFGFKLQDYVPNLCILSEETQLQLTKPRSLYTQAEFQLIERIFACMPSFLKYPPDVRKQLCRTVQYERYGPGRTMIKQGHEPISFYFVVNGRLKVYKEENGVRVDLNELTSGDSFGELAIFKKTKRSASVVTQTQVEVFRIDGPDFHEFIKQTADIEVQKKLTILKTIPFMTVIPIPQISKLAELCSVREYPTNSVILKERQVLNSVHFIMLGSVRILKIVPFQKTALKHNQYVLEIPAGPGPLVYKLLIIGELDSGQYFGHECILGTTKCPVSVVTNEPTQILRVSRSDLVRIMTVEAVAILESAERDYVIGITGTAPDMDVAGPGVPLVCVQRAFLDAFNWSLYRKRVVKQVLDEKRSRCEIKLDQLRLCPPPLPNSNC